MLNEEFIYRNGALEYKYLGLKKYLIDLHNKNIHDINLFLLISLEKDYYEGENLKKIVKDLVKLSNNLFLEINGEKINFKVNKISFDVGDILNRHRWIYRYNEKYAIENGLNDNEEDKIPENIKNEIQEKAYQTGKQQGFNWFKNHCIDAINEVLPENKKIDKNFQLNNDITSIFEGNKEIPTIEYICYTHWLEHKDYKHIEEILNKIRFLDNSVIERSFNYEANYFLERLINRNEKPKFPINFVKHSKDYLIDETIKDIVINNESKNILLYYFGTELGVFTAFKGKKAKSDIRIQEYYKAELSNIDEMAWVAIR